MTAAIVLALLFQPCIATACNYVDFKLRDYTQGKVPRHVIVTGTVIGVEPVSDDPLVTHHVKLAVEQTFSPAPEQGSIIIGSHTTAPEYSCGPPRTLPAKAGERWLIVGYRIGNTVMPDISHSRLIPPGGLHQSLLKQLHRPKK